MDAFIITRLETIMLRSPVSPYDVARFFIVGTAFAAVATQATRIVVEAADVVEYAISGAFLLWIVSSLRSDYRRTAKADRENSAGFQNSLKVESRRRRLILTVTNALSFALLGYNRELNSLTWTVFFAMELAYSYFQTLNWTPPAGRSWRWLPRLSFGGAG